MPDHSDDEQAIDENSFIVTVSLGSDRTMNFKRKHSKELIASVTLSDGMVLIFSKRSQYVFTHGIPPIVDTRIYLSLKHYMNNFCYQGPKLWNAISSSSTYCESITAAPTISCLKSRLKKFFINMQSYGDENEWQPSNNDLIIFLTTLKSDPYSNL